MVDSTDILSSIKENRASDKTFAEFIAELFKDKFIEVYLGDSYEDVSTEQISTSYPAVFCGRVIGAFKEVLAIRALHVDKFKKVSEAGIIFINERSIRALSEIDDGHSIQDMILRSNESVSVYNAFINNATIKLRK